MALALAASGALFPARSLGVCTGDCDGDGQVGVNELVGAVRIGLAEAALDSCAAADRNGNGAVSVDELVAAVTAALEGCPVEPTPTPGPAACPYDFSTDFEKEPFICAFRGRWNDACGADDLEVTFVVLVDEEGPLAGAIVADEPLRLIVGSPLNATQALVFAHGLLDDPGTIEPVGGSMEIQEGGRRLVVDPTGAPFAVRGCGFERFVGEFTGLVEAQ